jgi:archaetidylinositol phosphate synthase
MIEGLIRRRFESMFITPFMPLAKQYTANTITLAALVCGVLTFPLLAFKANGLALCALLISGWLDVLDGSVARYQKIATPWGAALDITCDRIVEISVILGLYMYHPPGRAFICLLMLASTLICVTTFLVVGIFTPKTTSKSFYYHVGLMERAEAFIIFAGMIAIPVLAPSLALIYTIMASYTALRRLIDFKESALAYNKKNS